MRCIILWFSMTMVFSHSLGCSLLVGNYESDGGQQDGGCTPHAYSRCVQGSTDPKKPWVVYWYDSCNNQDELPTTCPNGCNGDKCKDCTPSCLGKDCGLDSCGGFCGELNGLCGPNEKCQDGVCECPNKTCNGSCCPNLTDVCWPENSCCTPEDCTGRECGSDGCGQTCGSAACPDGSTCDALGHCICTATNNQPPCGSICCPHGFACDEQNKCGCDADHPLSCGSACCELNQDCVSGQCCTPQTSVRCLKVDGVEPIQWGIYWINSCQKPEETPIVTCTTGCDTYLNLCKCIVQSNCSSESCCQSVTYTDAGITKTVCIYPSCYQDVETCQNNPSSILTQCADDDRVCGLTSNCPVYCGTCPESQECDDKGQCCLPQDRCPTNCCPSGTFCLGTSCGMY